MKKYRIKRNYTALGEYLMAGREAALLTQRVVSRKLGYSSAQFISNFERGIAAPPLERLRVLLKMYNLERGKAIQLLLQGYRKQIESKIQK